MTQERDSKLLAQYPHPAHSCQTCQELAVHGLLQRLLGALGVG